MPRTAADRVAVVPMQRRHLRGVLAIEQLVYPRPWSRGLFVAELARSHDRRYVVALAPGVAVPAADPVERRLLQWWHAWRPGRAVVGYAGVMVTAGEAHITTVAVHPHQHRRKIASRLLLALLEEARGRGATSATLEVRAANRGAQRLYSGFGFAPVGVRPGYYAETGEDALIMWAHDLQGPEFAARLQRQEERLAEPGGSSGAPDLEVPWVRERVGLEHHPPEGGPV